MLEGGKGLWSLPTLRAATSDQNGHLPGRPWGLGWAVRTNPSLAKSSSDGSR